MDNIDRLNYLYKQKKTLEFKINIILTEMGLVKNEDGKYEELIRDYNKFNQELYDVEVEIVTRGGVLCQIMIFYIKLNKISVDKQKMLC